MNRIIDILHEHRSINKSSSYWKRKLRARDTVVYIPSNGCGPEIKEWVLGLNFLSLRSLPTPV